MKLAEEIIITVGGKEIELCPCLRYAIRLERREGSFAKLMRDVTDDSFSAAMDIIGDHYDHLDIENQVMLALPDLREPLLAYVMACAGIDPDDAPEKGKAKGKGKGKSISFAEHLAGLYRIGTGWLSWTPEQTLDATPAEIVEAYKGRLDMLKSIFGSGKEEPAKDDRPLDEKFRSIFAAHGTVKA